MRGYLGVIITLLALDGIWLLVIAREFYTKHLAHLLAAHETIWAVAMLYAVYAFGIHYFVLQQTTNRGVSSGHIIKKGALFGFIAYSFYNLTNQAMLIDWSVILTFADILWGTFITATAAYVGFYLNSSQRTSNHQ